jgi:hypothetical protein
MDRAPKGFAGHLGGTDELSERNRAECYEQVRRLMERDFRNREKRKLGAAEFMKGVEPLEENVTGVGGVQQSPSPQPSVMKVRVFTMSGPARLEGGRSGVDWPAASNVWGGTRSGGGRDGREGYLVAKALRLVEATALGLLAAGALQVVGTEFFIGAVLEQ